MMLASDSGRWGVLLALLANAPKAAVHAGGTLPPERKFQARATLHDQTHPMVLSQLRSREVVTCHGSAAATPLNLLKESAACLWKTEPVPEICTGR
jgi:hypothetical protein